MLTKEDMINKLDEMGLTHTETVISKNGIKKEGLVIGDSGTFRPVIYPENIIQDSESIEDFEKFILDILKSNKEELFSTDDLMSWDFAKDKVFTSIQQATDEPIPKVSWKDLEIYVRVELSDSASCKVVDNLCTEWNKTFEEVLEQAKINTSKRYFNKKLSSFISMPCDLDDIPMYVLSINSMVKGAIVMTDELYLNNFCKENGYKKIAIIPSSIHEVIVIPYTDNFDEDYINNMIRDVNYNTLMPEDILSDHVYYFEASEVA